MDSLSFFDALAVDLDGNPTNGVTDPSPAGVSVAISRTWLNLSHHAAWSTLSPYPYPVVATVAVGEITFLDVTVVSARRDGFFYFACWVGEAQDGMIGIAGPGFPEPNATYQGVLPDHVTVLRRLLARWGADGRIPPRVSRVSLRDALRFNQGDDFMARNGGPALLPTQPGQAIVPVALAFVAGRIMSPESAAIPHASPSQGVNLPSQMLHSNGEASHDVN